jgi:hypothetical protein
MANSTQHGPWTMPCPLLAFRLPLFPDRNLTAVDWPDAGVLTVPKPYFEATARLRT